MALPPASPQRQLRHRRSIDVQIFSCGGGLWEVDAELRDARPTATRLAAAVREAGDPIHDMLLRIVVDEQLNIREAGSETRWMPYPGHCDDHGDAYQKLVGLNLLKGFRQAVKERLSGVLGCTHITELTQVLPTAVIQAFAGTVLDTSEDSGADAPPFQLDRCHALRRDGEAVRTFYPRWHRPARDDNPGSARSDPTAERSP